MNSLGKAFCKLFLLTLLVFLVVLSISSCETVTETHVKDGIKYQYNRQYNGWVISPATDFDGAELIITEKEGDYPVVSVQNFSDINTLQQVKICSDTQLIIGEGAFSGCTALESVSLAGKNVQVSKNAFSGCGALKNVDFGQGAEEITVMEQVFFGCSVLDFISFCDGEIHFKTKAWTGIDSIQSLDFGSATLDLHKLSGFDRLSVEQLILRGGNLTYDAGAYGSFAEIGELRLGNGTTWNVKHSKSYSAETVVLEDGFCFSASNVLNHYYTGFLGMGGGATPIGAKIYMPMSVTAIPDNFFGNIANAHNCTVYYKGTEEEWQNISVTENDFYDKCVTVNCRDQMTYTVKYYAEEDVYLTANTEEVKFGGYAQEPQKPKRMFYDFAGWSTSPDAITLWDFSKNQVFDNVTLYAVWHYIGDTYEAELLQLLGFSFDGSAYRATVDDATIDLSSLVTVSEGASYVLVDSNGQKVNANAAVLSPRENTFTLTVTSMSGAKQSTYTVAVYRRQMHTVCFDAKNGSAMKELSVEHGELLTAPGTPQRENYIFIGWLYNGKPWDFSGDTVQGDICLQAQWAQSAYVVTFDYGTGQTQCVTLEMDAIPTQKTPTRENYRFCGWTLSNGKTYAFDFALNADTTLYAKWEKIIKYTVIFEDSEGQKIETLQVESGSHLAPLTPIKENHRFDGWWQNGREWNFENDTVTADTVLRAKWERVAYVVTFVDESNMLKSEVVNIDALPSRYMLSHDEHAFKGWKLETGEMYDFLVPLNKDVTLFAVWEIYLPVRTLEDLRAMDGSSASYRLMNDIACYNDVIAPLSSFSGVFDGNGHVIRDFSILGSKGATALFCANSGVIKNLTVSGAVVVEGGSDKQVAMLVAKNSGIIEGCTVLGSIHYTGETFSTGNYSGEMSFGGITAINDGTVVNCSTNTDSPDLPAGLVFYLNVTLKHRDDVSKTTTALCFFGGSIAGQNRGTVTDCDVRNAAFGTVDAPAKFVGNCLSYYTVNDRGKTQFYYFLGGVVGKNTQEGTVLKNSGRTNFYVLDISGADIYDEISTWTAAPVSNVFRSSGIGGIVGENFGTVSECLADGLINYVSDNKDNIGNASPTLDHYIGGVIGKNEGTVKDSLSHGIILACVSEHTWIGGIVGYNNGVVLRCYGNCLMTAGTWQNAQSPAFRYWDGYYYRKWEGNVWMGGIAGKNADTAIINGCVSDYYYGAMNDGTLATNDKFHGFDYFDVPTETVDAAKVVLKTELVIDISGDSIVGNQAGVLLNCFHVKNDADYTYSKSVEIVIPQGTDAAAGTALIAQTLHWNTDVWKIENGKLCLIK